MPGSLFVSQCLHHRMQNPDAARRVILLSMATAVQNQNSAKEHWIVPRQEKHLSICCSCLCRGPIQRCICLIPRRVKLGVLFASRRERPRRSHEHPKALGLLGDSCCSHVWRSHLSKDLPTMARHHVQALGKITRSSLSCLRRKCRRKDALTRRIQYTDVNKVSTLHEGDW